MLFTMFWQHNTAPTTASPTVAETASPTTASPTTIAPTTAGKHIASAGVQIVRVTCAQSSSIVTAAV
jgi:hypothetical protein